MKLQIKVGYRFCFMTPPLVKRTTHFYTCSTNQEATTRRLLFSVDKAVQLLKSRFLVPIPIEQIETDLGCSFSISNIHKNGAKKRKQFTSHSRQKFIESHGEIFWSASNLAFWWYDKLDNVLRRIKCVQSWLVFHFCPLAFLLFCIAPAHNSSRWKQLDFAQAETNWAPVFKEFRRKETPIPLE